MVHMVSIVVVKTQTPLGCFWIFGTRTIVALYLPGPISFLQLGIAGSLETEDESRWSS